MAKTIKRLKGHIIKKTTERDNTTYAYWVVDPKWDPEIPVWEADTIKECEEWIESV